MVKTVLLPFEGRIVYDGLLSLYGITFGGGIRRELNATYGRARQQGRILHTLEPEDAPPAPPRSRPAAAAPDWRPVVDGLVEQVAELRGGTPTQSAAFALLRASAELTRAVVHIAGDAQAVHKAMRQVKSSLTRVQGTL